MIVRIRKVMQRWGKALLWVEFSPWREKVNMHVAVPWHYKILVANGSLIGIAAGGPSRSSVKREENLKLLQDAVCLVMRATNCSTVQCSAQCRERLTRGWTEPWSQDYFDS